MLQQQLIIYYEHYIIMVKSIVVLKGSKLFLLTINLLLYCTKCCTICTTHQLLLHPCLPDHTKSIPACSYGKTCMHYHLYCFEQAHFSFCHLLQHAKLHQILFFISFFAIMLSFNWFNIHFVHLTSLKISKY